MPLFPSQPVLESHGYNETLPGKDWGTMARFLGNHPVAAGVTDWAAGIGAGVLQVTIAPGLIYGDGVDDLLTSQWVASLPSLSTAGQSRWDTIWIQRDFGANKTGIGYTLGAASASPMANPVVPADTDLQRFSALALARVDAGKTQIGAVESLRGYPGNTFVGPVKGLKNPQEGQHLIDPQTGIDYVLRGGQWQRVGTQITTWTGASTNWASGYDLNAGVFLNPWWAASTIHGANTLVMPSSVGHGNVIPAGSYNAELFIPCSPYLGSMVVDIIANPTALTTSTAQTTPPGGRVLGTFQNGASKMFTLTAPTPVTFTLRKGTNNSDIPNLYQVGNYLDITRLGDA